MHNLHYFTGVKLIQKTCNIQETNVRHDHLQIKLCTFTSKPVFSINHWVIHSWHLLDTQQANLHHETTPKFVEKPLQHLTFDPWHQCPAESCPTWRVPMEFVKKNIGENDRWLIEEIPLEWYHTHYIRNQSLGILKNTLLFFFKEMPFWLVDD